jgi:hypothetical protein
MKDIPPNNQNARPLGADDTGKQPSKGGARALLRADPTNHTPYRENWPYPMKSLLFLAGPPRPFCCPSRANNIRALFDQLLSAFDFIQRTSHLGLPLGQHFMRRFELRQGGSSFVSTCFVIDHE